MRVRVRTFVWQLRTFVAVVLVLGSPPAPSHGAPPSTLCPPPPPPPLTATHHLLRKDGAGVTLEHGEGKGDPGFCDAVLERTLHGRGAAVPAAVTAAAAAAAAAGVGCWQWPTCT